MAERAYDVSINFVKDSPSAMEEFEDDRDCFATKVSVWRQCRALFLKDCTMQWRSIGTSLCQLLTPIIFICFAGVMQVIVNGLLFSHGMPVPGSQSYPMPIDIGRQLVCQSDNYSTDPFHHPQVCRDEIFSFFEELDWEGLVEWADNYLPNVTEYTEMLVDIEQTSFLPQQQVLFNLPFYYFGKSHDVDWDFGAFTFEGERTGWLGSMVPSAWTYNFSMNFTIDPYWRLNRWFPDNYTNEVGPYIKIPFFLPIENRTQLNKRLVQVINDYNSHVRLSSAAYDQYERNYVITPISHEEYVTVEWNIRNGTESGNESYFERVRPCGGLFVDKFSTSEDGERISLSYTMVVNELIIYMFSASEHSSEDELHYRNTIINMMSNALFKNLTGLPPEADVAIATYIMPLPGKDRNVTFDLTSLLGGIMYPFAASFLIPVFTSALVKDKHERHLIMMEQNGLSRWTYWFITYCFNYLLYVAVAIVIAVFSFIFQMRLFTQTSWLVLTVVFLLWGHAQVVLGFFLSNFFSRPRTATIVGYLIIIAGVIVSIILEVLQIFPVDHTPFPLYMMYPPFAFYRLLYNMNMACLAFRCHTISVLSATGGLNLTTTAILYLGASTIGFMVLSVYLSSVLPGEYGVRKSPIYPILAVWSVVRRVLRKLGVLKQDQCKDRREQSPALTNVNVDMEEVDEDVQAEEESLRHGFPPDAPIVIYHLQKEYPCSGGSPPNVAVQSVSLAIQRNECFGLLGPNGAGKTTLISVLTGLYEPTWGTARIAGYNISTDITEVHHHLGVCPQFDIQHADLTVKEHLLFYARLKGVFWTKEKSVVRRALRQVNLYNVRNRKSKALSGGMKRRLSVAMACIGNPDILILDEPTTGLDPASRRQVWEVIQRVKEGKSVILTTHAMEEADHLCTRIGIMNYGRLCCLGTQSRLKARFGSGYQLQFNCASGRVGAVEAYIHSLLPNAVHIETFADSCSFKLEREDLVVSELFHQLDEAKVELGILDWGIKMTTLEDVFLNIVRQSQNPHGNESHSYCPQWLPCPCRSAGCC